MEVRLQGRQEAIATLLTAMVGLVNRSVVI